MNYQTARIVFFLALAALVSGCASGYKQFYIPAQGATPEVISTRRVAPPPPIPILERAPFGDTKAILDAYTKRGYVMIGSAVFNSGKSESEDAAVNQGREVGADLVLVLNPKYSGSVTSSIPITTPTTSTSYTTGSATAYGSGGSATAYGNATTTTYGSTTNYVPFTVHRSDYGAVYFVKFRYNFGATYRDLNDSERQALQSNKGVVLLVIVDGSPAFEADLLVGDLVVAADNISVSNSRAFSEMLRARSGQRVTLSILRRGERIEKVVQLLP